MHLHNVSNCSSREKTPKTPERKASTTVLRSDESSNMITRARGLATRSCRVTSNPASGSRLRVELMMHTSGFFSPYVAKISAESSAEATTDNLWRCRAVAINSQLISHDSATKILITESFSAALRIWFPSECEIAIPLQDSP